MRPLQFDPGDVEASPGAMAAAWHQIRKVHLLHPAQIGSWAPRRDFVDRSIAADRHNPVDIQRLSRDAFYRYQTAVDAGGAEPVVEKSRREPNQRNRTDETTEAAVVALRWTFRPVARYGRATSSASKAYSSRP